MTVVTWGLSHLLGGLLPVAAAWLVYATRPRARQNRLLGAALLFEGILFIWVGVTWLTDAPEVVRAARVVNQATGWGWLAAYVLFLGTIDSRRSRPLAGPAARRLVIAAGATGAASVLIWPDAYFLGVHRLPIGTYDTLGGPLNVLVFGAGASVVFLYGLVVAYTAWRTTPAGTASRARAGAYLAAFGVAVLVLAGGDIYGMSAGAFALSSALQLIVTVLLVALLAYGILRTQLFDIDLKIKGTLRQSTIAAVFVAAVFLVSEGAQLLFGDENAWLGLLAGGALVFALAPLQRFAERVSDAAMPNIRESDPEYVRLRKADVYRAAIEGAVARVLESEIHGTPGGA